MLMSSSYNAISMVWKLKSYLKRIIFVFPIHFRNLVFQRDIQLEWNLKSHSEVKRL